MTANTPLRRALRRSVAPAMLAAGLATAMVAPAQAQRAEPCIGASWELTGALAHIGRQIRYGVEVALAEINEAGGVLGQELRLVVYDDMGEPARAVDNALRIGEQDNCIAMIGGARTPSAIALREPLHDMELPWLGVISAGTRVLDHEGSENVWMFRVGLNDTNVAPFLLQEALAASPNDRVAFMHEATAWGQGALPNVERAFSEAGVELLGVESFNIGDTDMTAQLMRLRDAGVEALVYYGLDNETDALLRSMERLDYRPTIFAAQGIGAQLAETAGRLADGHRVMGTFTFWGDLSEPGQRLLDSIVARYDEVSGPRDLLMHSGTASAYDVTHIIARAIEIAGEFDRGAVRDALFEVEFEGVNTHFNPAFTPGNHDALTMEEYLMLVFYDGMVLRADQSPFGSN
ncbi:MAG: ABC transporter substrate-binding protein [Alkalilacustris sp.]